MRADIGPSITRAPPVLSPAVESEDTVEKSVIPPTTTAAAVIASAMTEYVVVRLAS